MDEAIKRRSICGMCVLIFPIYMGRVVAGSAKRDYLVWTGLLDAYPIKQVMSINPIFLSTCQTGAAPHMRRFDFQFTPFSGVDVVGIRNYGFIVILVRVGCGLTDMCRSILREVN